MIAPADALPRLLAMVTPRDLRRFVAKIRRATDGSACWRWTGYVDRKGYGQFRLHGRAHWAHRVSYALLVGDIPDGETVHHRCGNPGCVNPAHLTLASRAENTAEQNRQRSATALGTVPDDGIPF